MPDLAVHSDLSTLRARLERAGQGHVLGFYDELSMDQRAALMAQLETLDLNRVPEWVSAYVTSKPAATAALSLAPAPYYPYDPGSSTRPYDARAYRSAGEHLLRTGRVAAFVVAGGQGSRLGFEGPKGCYPATPVLKKPLFRVFAEQLLAARRRFGRVVPWYIMTSPLNDAATRDFFGEHDCFGLGRENVMFFPQGVMPSFDMKTGRILMASKHEVATNPDGHGGAVRALHASGALADMRRRGIEHLSYFQVDNPHVKMCDPLFIGLHATAPDSSAEMSSKMVPKASWDEKVGVFCVADRGAGPKLDVIEYSDMPTELAKATNADGTLRFNAGSIAIHMISVGFLDRLATDRAFELPFHRAEKKIPHVDSAGNAVMPTENNGVKLERFIFDALALARSSIVYETERVEEFAPIKNASGTDSVETSRRLQTERAARWIEAAGGSVPRRADGSVDAVIELSPLTACGPEELPAEVIRRRFDAGESVAL